MPLLGHVGEHPEYDALVWERMRKATEGKTGEAFNNAFDEALEKIREETEMPGTLLNKLATGQGR